MNGILDGIRLVFGLPQIGMMVLGSVIGIVVGAIPGLTGTMAIALVLPITLYVSPWMGIPLILAIYKASTWAGSVGSILLNTPGNAACAAMALDGYPMKQQGKGLKALKATLLSGVFSDFLSDIITILVCAPLAGIALMFGPPEFMILVVMALMVIATVGSGDFLKSVIAAAFGLFVALIGLDPVLGSPRLTFGFYQLMDGIRLVPLLIGSFAFSEMIQKMADMREDAAVTATLDKSRQKEKNRLPAKEFFSHIGTIFRSMLIGTGIGVLPGIGSGVSPWVAYSAAKRASRHPEEYGNGSLEGLMAAQAGANAVSGANLIPLLTLGIPGDTAAAMLIGTLVAHGLNPGPLIFERNPAAIYAIYATLIICDGVYLLVGWLTCHTVGRITMVRNSLLVPFVSVFCIVGTYAYNRSFFDVMVMFAFGIIGYAMKCTGTNVPIFVIAFILGSIFETNLRQSLVLYDGNLLGIFARPICMVLGAVIAAVVIRKIVLSLRNRIKNSV